MTTSISTAPTAVYLPVDRVGRQLWRVRQRGSSVAIALLEVIRLDRTDWRVSDSTLPPGDPHRLLGYVERLARDTYEVLWLKQPLGWSYVGSFDRGLAALADRDSFSGSIEETRRPPARRRDSVLWA